MSTVLEFATRLTELTIPILMLRPGRKVPLPLPEGGGWWVLDRPFWTDLSLRGASIVAAGPPNTAALLGRTVSRGETFVSQICAVDVDSYHVPTAVDKARELGVSSKDPVWAQRTGLGGFHVFYRIPPVFELERNTAAAARDQSGIDLLVNGYAVVAPSDTSKEPDGGGPYKWVAGHSPLDITLVDLPYPPEPLLEFWAERVARTAPEPAREKGNGSRIDVAGLFAGVRDGERNERLFREAARLRAKGVPQEEAEGILLLLAGQCQPPLPEREALACLASAYGRYRPGRAEQGRPGVVSHDDSGLI